METIRTWDKALADTEARILGNLSIISAEVRAGPSGIVYRSLPSMTLNVDRVPLLVAPLPARFPPSWTGTRLQPKPWTQHSTKASQEASTSSRAGANPIWTSNPQFRPPVKRPREPSDDEGSDTEGTPLAYRQGDHWTKTTPANRSFTQEKVNKAKNPDMPKHAVNSNLLSRLHVTNRYPTGEAKAHPAG